jgi:hypothetical protein
MFNIAKKIKSESVNRLTTLKLTAYNDKMPTNIKSEFVIFLGALVSISLIKISFETIDVTAREKNNY